MEISTLRFLPLGPPAASSIPVRTNPEAVKLTTTRGRRTWKLGSSGEGMDKEDTPTMTTSTEAVEIKFKRGSKKRRQKLAKDEAEGAAAARTSNAAAAAPKKWEEMSISEKAIELYVGEKGVLFWLNKFAYASIFIVIGGWILFRFVGPALNLYQLDTPPLAPSSLFKGS